MDAIGGAFRVRTIARAGAYLFSADAAGRALFIDAFDATWAMTPEQGPVFGDSTDDFKQFGEALVRSYLRMYQAGLLPDRTTG